MKADSSPIRTADHCSGYKKTGKFHSKLAGFGGRGWIRTTEAEKQQIYSLPPLATRELVHIGSAFDPGQIPGFVAGEDGAGGRTRTPDLLITNQLLYQLSYTSKLDLSLLPRQMVGATGLEPAASWSQTKHSTKLSYAPVVGPLVTAFLFYHSSLTLSRDSMKNTSRKCRTSAACTMARPEGFEPATF